MKIYPAILTGSIQVVQEQLDIAQSLEGCDVVHIDLIDGYFADNITVSAADLSTCEYGDLQCDLHLMAVDPEDMVNEVVEFASLLPIRSIIAQVEKMGNEQSFVDSVTRQGWRAGISLDIDTDIESIEQLIWSQLQVVQVMGVHAGEQGQSFIERSRELITACAKLRQKWESSFELIVDGGILPPLIPTLEKQSVDSCAIGSYIWKGNPVERWHELVG